MSGVQKVTLRLGDCVEVLSEYADGSIQHVVCDPPYGLKFMGKDFDNLGDGASQRLWHAKWLEQAFRVLPEDGVLKAFSGTRTYHHLAKAMEDVGFTDIRLEAWLYGQGMPKSTNMSKSIDKLLGQKRAMKRIPYSPNVMQAAGGQNIRPWAVKAEKLGYHEVPSDEPASPEAKEWDGWGTGLKPSWEPVLVGRRGEPPSPSGLRAVHLLRKPVGAGSATKNVLEHGTGALNINAARIQGDMTEMEGRSGFSARENEVLGAGLGNPEGGVWKPSAEGRWPSNVIIQHLPGCTVSGSKRVTSWDCEPGCPAQGLDGQSGVLSSGGGVRNSPKTKGVYGAYSGEEASRTFPQNSGGASRFFLQLGGKHEV